MMADSPRGTIFRYFARFDEGRLVRAVFFGMVIGAGALLGYDLNRLVHDDGLPAAPVASPTAVTVPVLPAADMTKVTDGGRVDPRRRIDGDPAALREPVRFVLEAGGLLRAVGTIDLGAAQRFAREISLRGKHVRTISLDSPGGSLDDAMAIARLIRKHGFATQVEDGAICASSCPLVLAGGAERRVGERGAVGLHQFYAAADRAAAPEQAMADAQMTTARISRLLIELDVDPALWLHALDTPPRSLYYLSPDQMRGYRLVTGDGRLALRAG